MSTFNWFSYVLIVFVNWLVGVGITLVTTAPLFGHVQTVFFFWHFMRLCNPLHLRQVWRPQAIASVVYRHIHVYIKIRNLRRTSSISNLWWSWILHSVLARLWKLLKTEIAGASDYRDCHEGRAIEWVLGFTLQRPARVSKTIEQVLKSHSSFCYLYSIKGCKCRGCGNATWLECWGACSCCSCFNFLFSIFFPSLYSLPVYLPGCCPAISWKGEQL